MFRTITLALLLSATAATAGAQEDLDKAFSGASSIYGQLVNIERNCGLSRAESQFFYEKVLQRLMIDPTIDLVSARQTLHRDKELWGRIGYQGCQDFTKDTYRIYLKNEHEWLDALEEAVKASKAARRANY